MHFPPRLGTRGSLLMSTLATQLGAGGLTLPSRHRPITSSAHRTRATPRHGTRAHQAATDLPRTAPLQAPDHRTDLAPLQPSRTPHAAARRPQRAILSRRTHKPADSGPYPTSASPLRPSAADRTDRNTAKSRPGSAECRLRTPRG